MFLGLGYEGWAYNKGYGMRWMVETAYSTFRRLFGECSLSRSLENIAYELVDKVYLYNLLVNVERVIDGSDARGGHRKK